MTSEFDLSINDYLKFSDNTRAAWESWLENFYASDPKATDPLDTPTPYKQFPTVRYILVHIFMAEDYWLHEHFLGQSWEFKREPWPPADFHELFAYGREIRAELYAYIKAANAADPHREIIKRVPDSTEPIRLNIKRVMWQFLLNEQSNFARMATLLRQASFRPPGRKAMWSCLQFII